MEASAIKTPTNPRPRRRQRPKPAVPRPSAVERYFQYGVEWTERVLRETGLFDDTRDIDLYRYVRLRGDGTYADDLAPDHSNLRIGESAVAIIRQITDMFGAGSEQAQAASFLAHYRTVVRCIDMGEFDEAMYRAMRLGQWVAESEAPHVRAAIARSARIALVADRKARVLHTATEISNRPEYRGRKIDDTTLAQLIRARLLQEAEACEAGDPREDIPSERTIRRYLAESR